jgi:hypothetical protein
VPFFADIGARDEPRGPIWAPFAVVRDNVERLVLVNLGWSLQLLPGILALAFSGLPLPVRAAMLLYSATATLPATGMLYALAADAARGEHLSLELAVARFRALARPSFRALAPLWGIFGLLIWVAVLAGPAVPPVRTAATLAALLWALCATYWGPLLVDRPDSSALALARRSARLVWRFPGETLATAAVVALALLVGLVSIGGLILIVPVVVALLHTHRALDLVARHRALRAQE